MPTKSNKTKAWVLAIVIAALLFAFRLQILSGLGSYLVRASPPEKADAALVLAGDGWGHRIVRGAELVRQGFVPVVLVSGPNGNYGIHECDLAIAFAVKHGYPESYFVHFENTARSTLDEARYAIPEIKKRGYQKILLVTSDFHTRRAGEIFAQAADGVQIVVVASHDEYFTAQGWWKNRQGQKTFLNEWEKTVAAWLGI